MSPWIALIILVPVAGTLVAYLMGMRSQKAEQPGKVVAEYYDRISKLS